VIVTSCPTAAASALSADVDAWAQIDPSHVTTAEIAELAIELQRQRHRLDGIAARLLERWHHSGVWALDGSRSPATHLARELRCSITTARGTLRQANATTVVPIVTQAVIDGHLSVDHLDLFAATCTPARANAMSRDEQQLVDQCRTLNFAGARTLLAYWAQAHDANLPAPDTDEAEDSSRVFLSETFQGTWRLDGSLDPLAGGIVATELDRLDELLRGQDAANCTKRTRAQRRAAALVDMAKRSAQQSEVGRPARPLFTVLVGQDTLKNVCELAEGTVIAPGQLVPWLSSANYETILFDGPHTVISVSHQRRFTGALRRAIEVRDRRCTHPSDCDIPASRCDVDHIVPYAHHGPTSQFNGRLQCATHNRNQARHVGSPVQAMPHRTISELDHIRGRLRYEYLSNNSNWPAGP
jgi:hypothetical protein